MTSMLESQQRRFHKMLCSDTSPSPPVSSLETSTVLLASASCTLCNTQLQLWHSSQQLSKFKACCTCENL